MVLRYLPCQQSRRFSDPASGRRGSSCDEHQDGAFCLCCGTCLLLCAPENDPRLDGLSGRSSGGVGLLVSDRDSLQCTFLCVSDVCLPLSVPGGQRSSEKAHLVRGCRCVSWNQCVRPFLQCAAGGTDSCRLAGGILVLEEQKERSSGHRSLCPWLRGGCRRNACLDLAGIRLIDVPFSDR